MKAVVAAFNQEKALVGAFSVIVQPVVEPMDRFAALVLMLGPSSSSSMHMYSTCHGHVISNQNPSFCSEIKCRLRAVAPIWLRKMMLLLIDRYTLHINFNQKSCVKCP